MKNIDNIKLSICNAINSLSEEELHQLIELFDARKKDGWILSILAAYSCAKCEEIFGSCEDYDDFDMPCDERFHDYCNMEVPESENKTS